MRESDHRYTNPEWAIQELKERKNLTLFLIIILLVLPLNLYYIENTLSELTSYSLPSSIIISLLIAIFTLYSFYLLITKNRDFILYDIFYTQALKIKILTITDDLSPFTPISQELEKIIIGRNNNNNQKKRKEPLKNKILFFWIRKNIDTSIDEIERKKNFKPFLSLIIILFALKEKRFKLIGVIGLYFTIIGFLFSSYMLLFITEIATLYNLSDTWVAIILIFFLLYWYILTVHSAVKLVSIDSYLEHINQEVRRPYLRKKIQLGDSYQQIIDFYHENNAIYIYDYHLDKYQLVDDKYLYKNLPKRRKLVKQSIGILLTVLISAIFFLFLEISNNVVFTQTGKIHEESIKKLKEGCCQNE